ncbi:MAG: hypothetical protein RL685_2986 [Pseudomonadota bacterium]|jgi:hypothetical protein
MAAFHARIQLLGINPWVALPARELSALFRAAGRDKGPIRVRGFIDDTPFRQTLVKYQGEWRLYLNTPVRRAAGKDVGERVRVTVELNPTAPREPVPPELKQALAAQPALKAAFAALAPSRRKEICRNLAKLKSAAARERNLQHVLRYLAGERSPSAPAFLRSRAGTSTAGEDK